jgi:nucleotide-binding universal stress UspA family protein
MGMPSKEVLVGVDASKRSEMVVAYACDMASKLSATVHLLYVEPVMPIPPEFRSYAKQENVDEEGYNEAVGQAVLAKLEGIAKGSGSVCDTDLEHGNPAEVILKFGSRPEVLMTIVGLRGLHGVGKVQSLGSVARRVIERSRVPVVVVPT